jgi:Iron-sulfur cluster assembly protein
MVRGVRIDGGDVAVTIALTVAGCPLRSSFEFRRPPNPQLKVRRRPQWGVAQDSVRQRRSTVAAWPSSDARTGACTAPPVLECLLSSRANVDS